MKLSETDFTFSLKETIATICENFFQSLGLSYFQFMRCYHDGAVSLLTNDTRLYELFQHVSNKPVVYSSFNERYEKSYQYWFTWDESLPDYPVTLAKNLNIHHGMTLVRRQKNYYDMIAVALPQAIDDPTSFYLNKLAHIENFIANFEKQHFKLIHQMDNKRLSIPKSLRDTNYRNLCLSKGKLEIMGNNGLTYLTTQELQCSMRILQGYSHKEIAKILSISPRSVETYLSRAKTRAGFNSTQTLCDALRYCP